MRQRGIEGQFAWRPFPQTSLTLAAAHLEAASANRFGSYSTSAPRNTVHLLLTQRLTDTLDTTMTYHQQSSYNPIGVSEPQPGFSRVDLRVAKSHSAGTCRK